MRHLLDVLALQKVNHGLGQLFSFNNKQEREKGVNDQIIVEILREEEL